MEFPSPFLVLLFFILSGKWYFPQVIFAILWLSHYLHRAFIYPFRQSGKDKPYPVILVLMAFVFNCFNGFVNGRGVFHLHTYTVSWLFSWQFIAGTVLFISGFIINKMSDEKLRAMRSGSPNGYKMPEGWLFNYISSPHYLGEIIEWTGWAILTWSLPGMAFAVFTFANLFPRAVSSHRWYRQNFPDYPVNRKALIPYVV